jgi:hypothetical protein
MHNKHISNHICTINTHRFHTSWYARRIWRPADLEAMHIWDRRCTVDVEKGSNLPQLGDEGPAVASTTVIPARYGGSMRGRACRGAGDGDSVDGGWIQRGACRGDEVQRGGRGIGGPRTLWMGIKNLKSTKKRRKSSVKTSVRTQDILKTVNVLKFVQCKPRFKVVSYNLKRFTIFLGIHLHTHEYTWARPWGAKGRRQRGRATAREQAPM